MSTESLYKKGLKVWIPHVNKIWEWAEILKDYNRDTKELVVETGLNSEIITLIIKSDSDFPPLCDPEDFLVDEKKNLTSIRILHEACVLNILQLRFGNRCIYHYSGVTTIFVNPYLKSKISEGYNIFDYHGQVINNLRPHIFAVVERLYCKLEREKHNQSIIFTGKSGSGKTENAKQAILYLTTISAKENQIKKNILASSIILESFGNAKTISNDNSSRFGKFIELQYNADYLIIGASIKIFLLDRSRVVRQSKNEENYHVFYELCSANDCFPHLKLIDQEFHYLNKRIFGTILADYFERFEALLDAFNVLCFSDKQQKEIFHILAAVLHLGNLNFKKCDNLGVNEQTESCFILGLHQLQILARLFGLDDKSVKAMRKWMCHKRVFFGQNEIVQPMSTEEAMKACSTLAMFIYTKLFIWIVAKINVSLSSPCNVQSFIGILDLYGFQNLDVNLFEQFCINYANEKIHQNFVQSIFKLEQEEYLREDIGWNFMRYHDNRFCIELIEGKLGIIDILEEETKTTRDHQIPWVFNVSDKCEKSKHFKQPVSYSTDFIIHHFIDSVQYDSSEFLEKNQDLVFKEHLGFLKDTKNEILNELIKDEYRRISLPKEKKRLRRKPRVLLSINQTKKTVCVLSEFRKSLISLSSTLKNTTAHYVRCIKSNDEKKPYEFDPACVAQQMRTYNILDTIQISSMGYFSRKTYSEFFRRYHCLCQFEKIKLNDLQEICRMIIYTHIDDLMKVKFGKTKIFLKDDCIDHLENVRQEKRFRASIAIQKNVRRFLQQKRYQKIRDAIIGLQNQARKYLISRCARDVAENDAAIKIQTCVRKWMSRCRQQSLKRINLAPQNYSKLHEELKNAIIGDTEIITSAAIDIQRLFRGVMARRTCKKRLRNIVIIQACVRRFLAKVAADKLRRNRNERVELFNKSLKIKIDTLQRKIDAYNIEKTLTVEEVDKVQTIVDNQQCNQAKNRISDPYFLSKLQTLKSFCEKTVNNCDVPVINEKSLYEECIKANEYSLYEAFKPLIQEKYEFTLYQPLLQAYFNFDQRIKKFMETFRFRQFDIVQLSLSRKYDIANENTLPNNQLAHEEIVNYQGMFQFNTSDINMLLTRLVLELHSSLIIKEEPKIPSRILFMCVRYIDSLKDFNSAYLLIENYIKAVKYVVKQRGDHETIFIWLVNTYQLLNYLKQYSITHNNIYDQFHAFNDDRQNAQRLVNLDLIACWESLLETTQWLVRAAQKLMKTTISELTLPGLLQYNPLSHTNSKNSYEHHEEKDHIETEVEGDKIKMSVEVKEFKQHQLQLEEQDQEEELQSKNYKPNQHRQLIDEEVQEEEFIQELLQEQTFIQEQAQEKELNQSQTKEKEAIQEQSVKKESIQEQNVKEESIQKQPLEQVRILPEDEEQNQEEEEELLENNYDQTFLKSKQDALLQKLTDFLLTMRRCGLECKMIQQMFQQLFDFMSTIMLSHIISRPELCNCYRGSLARLNLNVIDKWALHNKLTVATIALGPIKQAMRLLQMQPIHEDEIYWISKFYDKLNCNQITKILSCYKPAYAVDRILSPYVKQRLHLRLAMRQEHENTVLIDSEEYAVSYPFRHCSSKLEEVEIPATFNLSMLRKI